ncbi:MAG: glutamate-5-semialdehyde dehydrogenase [Bacteroidales bacterium]|nr:glutamate-5-semialdehyde dehydrogenase [Bacteroidales bacterium]
MSEKDKYIKIKEASVDLIGVSEDVINDLLVCLAEKTKKNIRFLLDENIKDLKLISKDDPKYDRLKLTPQIINEIADNIINVSKLKNPVGEIISEKKLPNELMLLKKRVPLGVIGIIYEARPNVTFDVFVLCFKTKNACVLKGGKEAENSNKAIVSIIKETLKSKKINENVIQLLDGSKESTTYLLNAREYVDLIIPRGSQALIDFVVENSRIPIIETGAGIVHVYYDEFADKEKGIKIIHNSKTRRVSVCNALDCLLVNEKRLSDLPDIAKPLAEKNVEIFADEKSFDKLKDNYPSGLLFRAKKEHYGIEFLSYKMSIKTISNIDEAISHILKHSSKHSEAIISENKENIENFLSKVDAAVVYANASTAFTDGAEFGLGAEIGISTQKMHARGPMGLEEITSYKWVVYGKGQIRK